MVPAVLATSNEERTATVDTTTVEEDGMIGPNEEAPAATMLQAFAYPTSPGTLHRDLKPEVQVQNGVQHQIVNGTHRHPSLLAGLDMAALIQRMDRTSMHGSGRRNKSSWIGIGT